MSEQEKRLGLNEAMFREINERLEAQLPTDRSNRLSVLCECADPDCTERIKITPDEYQAARAKPRQFILVHGHELVEIRKSSAATTATSSSVSTARPGLSRNKSPTPNCSAAWVER